MATVAEIVEILLQVILPIAATAGLFFAGYQIYGNSKEQKESNRIRELQLLESAFNQINAMEQYFYEQEAKGPTNSIYSMKNGLCSFSIG
ncbi:MAG: hypothetical protein QOK66_03260 [Nitrososphaeraceae archaeon]|nr:hypothetical protein [Nitrososphaeraceae archaeon]